MCVMWLFRVRKIHIQKYDIYNEGIKTKKLKESKKQNPMITTFSGRQLQVTVIAKCGFTLNVYVNQRDLLVQS